MNRIQLLRESKGLSIRELAKFTNQTPSTISRAENGERKVSVELAKALCGYFNVSMDFLLNRSYNKSKNNRLRELRENKGMSLRELAGAIGIDYSTIAFVERGQRHLSINSLKALCDFFGVSADYLLGWDSEERIAENPLPSVKLKPVRSKYTLVYMPDSPMARPDGWSLLHREVMAASIGRPLTSEEVVHHIDGNPANNKLSNLMLFESSAAHIRYHAEHRNSRKAQTTQQFIADLLNQ